MKRGEPLRSDPDKTRAWQQRSRRKLPAKSVRRAALEQAEDRPAVRAAVFARDRTCRLLRLDPGHACSGPLTPHHLLKASQGGQYTLENLVALCAGGNVWVEDEPLKARALGLVVTRGGHGV